MSGVSYGCGYVEDLCLVQPRSKKDASHRLRVVQYTQKPSSVVSYYHISASPHKSLSLPSFSNSLTSRCCILLLRGASPPATDPACTLVSVLLHRLGVLLHQPQRAWLVARKGCGLLVVRSRGASIGGVRSISERVSACARRLALHPGEVAASAHRNRSAARGTVARRQEERLRRSQTGRERPVGTFIHLIDDLCRPSSVLLAHGPRSPR